MYHQRLFIPPSLPVLANIHSILASESCCACLYDTYDVGLHTQFQFNFGPVSQPIWFNANKLPTTLAQHYSNTGSAVYLAAARPANMCHLSDAVLILAQSLRSWPDIEIALSDSPVFGWTATWVTATHFAPPVTRKATTQKYNKENQCCFLCLACVTDGGPIIKQRGLNISCLLGTQVTRYIGKMLM